MVDPSELDTIDLPSPVQSPETGSSLVEVDLGALSHPGKVRPNNEDHFLVARLERTMQTLLTNLPPGSVPGRYAETAYGMLVADGIGGAAAGEVASRLAISVLVDLVLRTPDWIMRLNDLLVQEVLERLDERFRHITEVLTEQARADPALAGMGTTLTVACSLGADLILGHVGDSRAYLFREGQLHQLTRDHTFAQALADCGAIPAEQRAKHPLRHLLTNVIATTGEKVKADLRPYRLRDGDQLLLCTDGLTEMVPDAAIARVLREPGPAATACQTLVDLALQGGGRDNVTVILGRYRIPDRSG